MGEIKRYVIIGAIVAVVVLIVALVATSLKKLASDEGTQHCPYLTLVYDANYSILGFYTVKGISVRLHIQQRVSSTTVLFYDHDHDHFIKGIFFFSHILSANPHLWSTCM